MEFKRVKIEIFIPCECVGELRDSLARAHAGRIGNYDHCVSVTQVKGYWRPLENANPYEGKVGELCEGSECKVEVMCPLEYLKDAVKAIRSVHPYEEPVYYVIPLVEDI